MAFKRRSVENVEEISFGKFPILTGLSVTF